MKNATTIGGKKENIFQLVARLFRESMIEPFVKDKRVRMTYAEKMRFIHQVRGLERTAVKNATA